MAIAASAPAIPAGAHVKLVLPHVGPLPATVEDAAPGALVVALAVKDARVERLAGREVSVEYTTGRGIQRVSGTLAVTAGRPEVVRVAVEGEAERIQRREWARVDAVVPVVVRGIDEPLGGETTTLNLSGGGILIRDVWQLPLGVDVRVELGGDETGVPIKFLGRIVREGGRPGEKGVRIDDIGRDDEERLVRLVRERERAALRTARGR